MTPRSKNEYAQVVLRRYKQASKKQKTIILNEFCTTTGYNRKYAIDKLNGVYKPQKRPQKPGPKSAYRHPDFIKVLKKIWLAANLPCSKRLKAIIPCWVPYLNVSADIQTLLLNISAPTIDRILKPIRIKFTRKGLSATKPGSLLRKSIPIKVDQWNEFTPGFVEGDTVHHCGDSLSGQYTVSLVVTDIASGWTESRATWGTGHQGIIKQLQDIHSSLPFPLLGFDSDCGHEFINHAFINYCHSQSIQFTRSRPYHKDDNAHIEQKNWTHIRQWLGYYRFDNPRIVDLLNDLYANELSLFHNFFLPSVKLLDKQRLGSKTRKIHDAPKTPYQRLLESHQLDQSKKDNLQKLYAKLDPFELRKTIERKLNVILKLASSP